MSIPRRTVLIGLVAGSYACRPNSSHHKDLIVMSFPELTPEQRMTLLNQAAEMRNERERVRQAIQTGEMSLADALDRETASEPHSKMKVTTVVALALGERRADEILARLGINDTRRIRGLSESQRAAILAASAEPA
jgi:hypothetical protein